MVDFTCPELCEMILPLKLLVDPMYIFLSLKLFRMYTKNIVEKLVMVWGVNANARPDWIGTGFR